jgi:catechol 2,3-dioxygenase-like lactoylglutathione lyase family enzyme
MLAYFADPTRCQQVGWSCCDLCRDLAAAQASYQKSLQLHGERRWQQRDTPGGALSRAGSSRYGSSHGVEDEDQEDEEDEDEDGADDGDDGNGGDDHASRRSKRARSNSHRSTGGFDLASDYFNYSAEAFDTGEEHDGDADDAGGGRHGSVWRGGGDERSASGKNAVHRPSVGVFQSASSAMAAANAVALPASIASFVLLS